MLETAHRVADTNQPEVVAGRAIKYRRDHVVPAAKFDNPMGGDPDQRDSSRRWITRAVEAASLRHPPIHVRPDSD
ncbi:hypothetical protein [Streptomyces marokkonensis]